MTDEDEPKLTIKRRKVQLTNAYLTGKQADWYVSDMPDDWEPESPCFVSTEPEPKDKP